MRVVDTSAWIEWLLQSRAGEDLTGEMPDLDQCIVPTIVQYELMKWMVREISENAADQLMAHTQECIVLPLNTAIALGAAKLSRQHRLATADAVIYATALASGADLLTCDAHFIGLPGVVYLAKAGRSA